jgi:cell division protein FtsI (penicillin-binding protein 3)
VIRPLVRLLARRNTRPLALADPARRLRISTAAVMVLLAVIGGRLIAIQLTDAKAYAAQGLKDRLTQVILPAPRGAITDRDGAVLSQSVEARYVYADPEWVVDPVGAAEALSPVLGVPYSELLPKLVRHRQPSGEVQRFEYLARGVNIATGDKVSAMNIAGVGVRRDESRIVPSHDLAANLIGFTGRDLTGLGGMESAFDDVLRGVDGERFFEVGQADPDGTVNLDHEIPGGYHEENPARPGTSLRLTIDRDLQYEVQRMLAARSREVNASQSCAVVIDVKTGEVLAQASYPVYDAANPLDYKAADRGDTCSGQAVDPGSVHKAVVIGGALQEGVITPSSVIPVTTSVTKGDQTFTDTHWHLKPKMTVPGILAYSSNIGTIAIADRLGAQKLYQYQRAFGLGTPTNEGVPGESGGLVQPPKNWSGSSYGSIPIGMGVSVTPLQMTAVYAAIANDGVWVQPHLIKATVAADGTVTPAAAPVTRRVLSAHNAAALRTMLEAVVTVPGATGLSAAITGYRVAGKTGTGKVVRDGHYQPGEVASFVGMAPADAPRYVIGVFAYTPGGNGGLVAGPAFRDMMAFALGHYAVPPTGTKRPKFHVYP